MKRKFYLLFLFLLSFIISWASAQDKITERIIYVPSEEWENVIKAQPKGISLSWEQYQDLLKKQPQAQSKPQSSVVVGDIRYQGKMIEKTLHFEMDMLLTSLSDGLQEFSFEFGKMGVEKALLNDKEALIAAEEVVQDIPVIQQSNENSANQEYYQQRLVRQSPPQQMANNVMPPVLEPKVRYRVLLQGKGEHRLKMFFFKRLSTHKDELKANLVLGEFAQQTFVLKTQDEMEYTIEPIASASHNGEMFIYMGNRSDFSLSMKPREQKDVKQPLYLAHVYASHLVRVDSITSWFQVSLEIYYQAQKNFTFYIPANVEILSISENRWESSTEGDSKKIIVQLEEAVDRAHTISIKCERQLLGDKEFSLPAITASGQNLLRQDGLIYIEKTPEIQLEIQNIKEARQITAESLFPRGKGAETTLLKKFGQEAVAAFKHAHTDYSIVMKKKEIVPVIESTFVAAISFYQDGLECVNHITFDTIEGKSKQLSIVLPQGWSVDSIEGYFARNANSAFSKFHDFSYYVKDSILYLSLRNQIVAGQRLKISLKLQNMPEGWQGDWEERQMLLPLIKPMGTKYLPSFAGVIVDPDYQMELLHIAQAQSVDINILRSLQVSSKNLRLGLKLNEDKASANISLKRKPSYTELTLASYISVEPERIRCMSVLVYDIKNASQNMLRFTMPKAFPYILHVADEFGFIKEKEQKEGKNGQEWLIKLQKRVIGTYSLYLTFEIPIQSIESYMEFPVMQFPGIEQRKGFIGICGISQAEITPVSTKGLSKILNTQLPLIPHPELPAGTEYLHAFKYANAEFQLSMEIKMHGKVSVANAILESVTISTLYPQKDTERVVCEYTLSHIGLQYFDLVLPKDTNLWSAVVDDKGEKPVKKDNTLSIPVPRENTGKANSIRVVYERKVPELGYFGTMVLERPQTHSSIPVKKFQWFLYLPPSYQVGKFSSDFVSGGKPWYKILGQAATGFLTLTYEKSVGYSKSQYHLSRDAYSMPKQSKEEYYNESQQNMPAPGVVPPPPASPSPAKRPMAQTMGKNIQDMKEKERRKTEGYLKKDMAKREEKSQLESAKPTLPSEAMEDGAGKGMPEVEAPMEEEQKSEEAPVDEESIDDIETEKKEKLSDEFVPPSPEPILEDKPSQNKIIEPQKAENDADEWDYSPKSKISPVRPKIPATGMKKAGEDQTGVYSVKAKGLRSLDIELLGSKVRSQVTSIGRQLPSSLACISLLYLHEETMRSLRIAFAALSVLIGLILIAQRRIPRVVAIMIILLVVSFIPLIFGSWLTPYSNAVAWGILGSVALFLAYRILWKIGAWFGLHQQTAALILVVVLMASTAMAQEPSKVRQIYVSYNPEKIEQLDQVNKVFLPYETYVTLWNRAYPDRPIEVAQKKQDNYFLYHADYKGKISGEQTQFTVNFLAEVFNAPIAMPLGLAQTAVQKATLYKEGEEAGQEVTLKPTENGYSIMLPKKGKYRIEMQFLPQGKSAGKRGSFQFGLIPIASSVLQFTLDHDLEANLSSFSGDWYEKKQEDGKTLTLFPGLSRQIAMDWYQSSESYKAKGLNINANSKHSLTVSDYLLRLESKIDYQILSGKIDRLNLKVPKDYNILRLNCTNLERWILSPEADHNSISIRLVDSSAQKITLDLVADKVLSQVPSVVLYPEIIPVEVERENGQAILITQNFYNVIVTRHEKLRKVSSYEQGQKFYEVFRYNEHPYQLEFSIQPQEYYNFSRSQLSLKIDEEKIQADYNTSLEVKGKEIFSYQIHFPDMFTITKVSGPFVKSWKVEKQEENQILHIPFLGSLKKGEKTDIFISMEKELKDSKSLLIPYLFSPQVHYSSGDILVASARDAALTVLEIKGLQEYDIASFGDIPDYVKRYAFRFEGTQYMGKVEIQSQQPQIEVDAIINLLVEDDWINFGYFLRYKIQFAAADTFTFRLPASLGEELDILGENIKDIKKTKQGKYHVWKVVLHTKVRDEYTLALFPRVMENQGTGVAFYPISFPPQIGARLYALVQNHSQYELSPQKIEGISQIGANQIGFYPPQTSAQDFLLAYKIERHDWELTFSENKQTIVHTVKASIDSIKVDTSLDKEGDCRHRIVYNIRHLGLQFLEIERLQNCQLWGVFVSGFFVKPVKKTVQEKEILLIPLQQNFTTNQKEERLSVRLIYSDKLPPLQEGISYKIPLPLVSNIKEVGSVHWTLHLPKGYIYRFGGNISPSDNIYFEEYQTTVSYDARDAEKQMILNKQLLQAAISRENRLKVRQDNYMKEAEQSQKTLFSNVLNTRQQQDASLNDSNLKQVKQYGIQNIVAAQRAGRDQSGASQAPVYKDQKSEKFAGEENESFLKRQEANVQKIFIPQEQQKKQTDPLFAFDIAPTADGGQFYFAKRQGDAVLEIRTFLDPKESKMWLGIQFSILFLLLILCAGLKLFSLKDGYSFRKFKLTLLVVFLAALAFGFLEFVHYFYL